jgi:hypothetical protein
MYEYIVTKQQFGDLKPQDASGKGLNQPAGSGWRLHSWRLSGGGADMVLVVWERERLMGK